MNYRKNKSLGEIRKQENKKECTKKQGGKCEKKTKKSSGLKRD